jgi:hypothetical protein
MVPSKQYGDDYFKTNPKGQPFQNRVCREFNKGKLYIY